MFTRIRRPAGSIERAEWDEIIRENTAFEPMPNREGINPFTNEKVVFPGAGKAFYVAGGRKVGNAVLENGEILTTGVPLKACEDLAARLGAEVVNLDRS